MDWKSLGKEVASAAPILGGVLGGPGGAAAGTLIASLFGVKADDPDAMSAAIKADPMAAVKLRELELNHQIQLEGLLLQGRQQELADVQNARQREVEVTKATGKRDLNIMVLAWVIIGGFLGLIALMIAMQFTGNKILQNDPLLALLLGSLATDAGMVVGYYFGSSQSSADKGAVMAEQAKALAEKVK